MYNRAQAHAQPTYPMRRPASANRMIRLAGRHLFLAAFSLFMLYPVLWWVGASLKTIPEMSLPTLWPSEPQWSNYVEGWRFSGAHTFGRFFANTLLMEAANVTGGVLTAAIVAYGFGRLGESYNKLGRHIEQLKDRLIRTEARKKEADLRALQAQIHPHFLYNTLSSVQWMAFMRGEQEIGEMVGALGHFLQFSLNKGREFCPVEQEVAHVRHYVRIQQYRYPDRFHLEVEEDPSLAGSLMLKLLLQPLVENAMMHGILKREGEGTIRVKLARSGKNMLVSVEDDGIGMSEARLSEVRAALRESGKGPGTSGETGGPGRGPGDGAEPVGSGRGLGGGAEQGGSGYGLGNVHERLLLHYGPGAELRLDSRPGGRTVVSFTIPVMEGHDETNDRR